MEINWLATGLGILAGIALSFLWYGPLFGRAWAAGSHNITRPERPPIVALAGYILSIVALGLVIGVTATTNALFTALAAIMAAAGFLFAGGLFSQKSTGAALIDGGSVLAIGAVMILAQGLL